MAAEEDANLQICINKWFLRSLNLIIFLTVKEIVDRASSNLPEFDHISPTTVWRFIRSQDFLSKLSIKKHMLTETQKLVRKKLWEQNIDRDWINVIFTNETTFRVGKKKRRCWLKPSILNYTSIRKLSKKINAWGAISIKGKINLYLFINNLTKEEYVKILSENLKDLSEIGGKKLFVSMRQWFESTKVN